MHCHDADLFWHVCLFRDAIDATEFLDDTPNMKDFPLDCCHHASKLLGLYLFDQGFGPPSIMSGNHPTDPRGQHQWLSVSGRVVDITADQFGKPDVIVAAESEWHRQLNGSALNGESLDQAYWNSVRQRPYHGPIYLRIQENIPDTPRPRSL